jgi:hypothetical protein
VGDRRGVQDRSRRLEEYCVRAAEATDGLDLLLTPTLAFVPPAITDDEIQASAGAIGPASLMHPWRRGGHAVAAAFQVGART